MAEVVIRQAMRADADAVAALMGVFFEAEGLAASAVEVAQRAPHFLEHPDNRAYIADAAGSLVGIVTVTTSYRFETGRSGRIEDLYVESDHRRAGVASQLVGAAVDWCRSVDCGALEVVVTPEGDRAHDLIGFYGSQGFWATQRTILERLVR